MRVKYNLSTKHTFRYLLIVITFVTLYISKTAISMNDKYIIYSALLGQLLVLYGLFFNKPFYREIGHWVFGIVLIIISFIACSPTLIFLGFFVLVITLSTRKLMGGCLFSLEDNYSLIPSETKYLKYDYMYAFILLKTIHRYYQVSLKE